MKDSPLIPLAYLSGGACLCLSSSLFIQLIGCVLIMAPVIAHSVNPYG